MTEPVAGRGIEDAGRWLTALRWGVAAAAVVGAHAATAYVLLNETPEPAPQGAEQAPILIDLAPPAAAPEIAAVEPTPEPVAEPAPEPVAEPTPEPVVEEPPTPEPDVVEPAPVPEPVVDEPEPEPVVEPPEDVPEPVEETPPEPVVEEPPPEPVVEETPPEPELPPAIANAPVPTARPNPPPQRREPPRETRTAERQRAAEPEPERPRARREAPREAERPARRQRQQAAAPSAASQGERRREASQGSQAAPSVSPARWQSQVQARLNRFKRTPRGGGRGTAQVSFAMDGSGRVTSVRLSRSAGSAALDEAAVSLVRRASPFPAPPGGSGLTLNVPIRFD